MVYLPTSMDSISESTSKIITGPALGNSLLWTDNLCVSGRAGINYYYSPNPLAKALFASSFICGLIGATACGTALATELVGIPVSGLLGSLSARGFNRLGKYALHMGHVSNGNINNASEIADLMI